MVIDAYAIIDPRAVMVKSLHTIAADRAMTTSTSP